VQRSAVVGRFRWPVVVAVVAVACHAQRTPPRARPATAAVPARAEAPVEEHEPVGAPQAVASVTPIAAPPSGAIVDLAISPDGLAALSADEGGELRLWPALDGSREPVAVQTASATAIALAHDAVGFTAYFIDDARALVIARLGADGAAKTQTIVASPEVEAFAMAEPGLVVMRRDQTVAVYAPDGTAARRIAADRGERIVGITAAGTHAAAIVERDGHAGIRVLELTPHLIWGAFVSRVPVDNKLAISPRGDRLAMVTRGADARSHLTVTDLRGETLFDEANILPEAIAFVDEDTVVTTVDREVRWIDLRTRTPRKIALHDRAKAVLGAAGGRAFTVTLGDIAIVAPSTTKFLGYALSSPRAVDQLPNGELLVANSSHMFTTDTQLELRRDLSEDARGRPVRDLRWLGGDDVAVLTDEMSGATGDSMLYIVDVARGQWTRLRTELSGSEEMSVLPSTGLVVLSGNRVELLRYRAARHTLVSLVQTPRSSSTRSDVMYARPLDPALAGGARVAFRHDLSRNDSDPSSFHEEHSVTWFGSDTVRGPGLAKQTVDGMVSEIDAAGHVYAWLGAEHDPHELTIFAPRKRQRQISVDGAAPIWPDPRGERFAMTYDKAVVMLAIDGTRRWSTPIDNAARVIWLRDGTLAVLNDSGIARLDPTDGHVLAVRCGWQFGLADDPHQTTYAPPQPVPSMCARLHP
jgi:hypothetical protein